MKGIVAGHHPRAVRAPEHVQIDAFLETKIPGCYVPAPAVASAPPNLATPDRIRAFAFGTNREREQLQADLTRLLEVDPARGRAYALDVLRWTATGTTPRDRWPKKWRAWAKQHGFYRREGEWLVSRRAAA